MNIHVALTLFSLIEILQIITAKELLHLSLKEISDCENYTSKGDFKVRSELKGNGSDVKLSGSVDLPFVLDEHIEYGLNISLWSEDGNKWDKVFTLSGRVCDGLKMVPKLWTKVAAAANTSEACPKQPGHYAIEDFPLDPKDVDVPIVLDGIFMIQAEIYKNGESVTCQRLTIEGTQ